MSAQDSKGSPIAGILVLAVSGWLLYQCNKSPSEEEMKAAAASAEACKRDLKCIGEKLSTAAAFRCPEHVERLAKHSVRWVDKTLEPKFSRFRWANLEKTSVTVIGDRVEFQNGFGAFTPIIYECDLDVKTEAVLDVRIEEGRLPP
ncbi:MAG: zinc ribbon domain-containing protein [Proteobacteria bacterium]|nr:MAG: zinc ribbon domain-containing protein [Pseudomonadota bacterium]